MRNIKTKAFAPYDHGGETPQKAEGKEINYSGPKDYTVQYAQDSVATDHENMNDPFSAKESLQNGLTLREKL